MGDEGRLRAVPDTRWEASSSCLPPAPEDSWETWQRAIASMPMSQNAPKGTTLVTVPMSSSPSFKSAMLITSCPLGLAILFFLLKEGFVQ